MGLTVYSCTVAYSAGFACRCMRIYADATWPGFTVKSRAHTTDPTTHLRCAHPALSCLVSVRVQVMCAVSLDRPRLNTCIQLQGSIDNMFTAMFTAISDSYPNIECPVVAVLRG
eukprot:1290041-Prymnesium_polylepis.1